MIARGKGRLNPLARLRLCASRLRRAEGGAAAVEFALIALPFFTLLFGLLEFALIFVMSNTLDNATATVSRSIRTGAQKPDLDTQQEFTAAICDNLGWFATDCASNLYVEVKTFETFASVEQDSHINDGVFDDGGLEFEPSGENDIVMVTAYYKWTLISPLLSKAVANIGNGKTVLMSALVFRNEPFGS